MTTLCKIALSCVAGFLLAFYLITGQVMSERKYSGDFFKFYVSGQHLLAGDRIYWALPDRLSAANPCIARKLSNLEIAIKDEADVSHEEVMRCLHPNLNTPALAMLIAPLALLDYRSAWWIWSAGSLLCALASLLLIQRHALPGSGSVITFLTLAIAFFTYAPTLINFLFGQLASYLLLPLVLAWLCLRQGRDAYAGVLLGLIASLKLFFGLFLIVFLLCRRWRAALAFTLACGSSFLLALLILGVEHHRDYLASLGQVTWQGANWNASLSGFFTRLLGGGETPALLDVALSSATATRMASGLVLLTLLAATRRAARLGRQPHADLLFSLVIPAMLLLSPLGWTYYFSLLALSLALLWHYSHGLTHARQYRLLLMLAVAMTALPRRLQPSTLEAEPLDVLLDAALPTYALVLLLLVGYAILRKVTQRISAQARLSESAEALSSPAHADQA